MLRGIHAAISLASMLSEYDTQAIKSHSAAPFEETGDKFTQVAPDLPLRPARALRQRPLVGRARRRRQALGF